MSGICSEHKERDSYCRRCAAIPEVSESRIAMILRSFKEGQSVVNLSDETIQPAWIEDIIRAYLLGVDAAKEAQK